MKTETTNENGISFVKGKLPEEMEDIAEELQDKQTIKDVKRARKEYKNNKTITYENKKFNLS